MIPESNVFSYEEVSKRSSSRSCFVVWITHFAGTLEPIGDELEYLGVTSFGVVEPRGVHNCDVAAIKLEVNRFNFLSAYCMLASMLKLANECGYIQDSRSCPILK